MQIEAKKKEQAPGRRGRREPYEPQGDFFSGFGRGGGGAPLRDGQGNIISDLRRAKVEVGNGDPFARSSLDAPVRGPPAPPLAPHAAQDQFSVLLLL